LRHTLPAQQPSEHVSGEHSQPPCTQRVPGGHIALMPH
jgi:hypothetical protein